MLKQNRVQADNHQNKYTNLWLGFAFGSVLAGSLVFLLATKKGREVLKKLLEFSENLEENAVSVAEQIEETFLEGAEKIKELKTEKPVLGQLLDKMKSLRN